MYSVNLQGMIEQLRREFDQKLNQYAGGLRKQAQDAIRANQQRTDEHIANLAAIARALEMKTSSGALDPGMVRINNIPGRRISYDMLVDIPIGSGVTSAREQSFTVTQEGPFVAVKRVLAFQSALEFSVTDSDSGDVADFVGRSYGRYRPAHSASDVMDSQHNTTADLSTWFATWLAAFGGVVNTVMPSAVLSNPSSASSWRTMEFDGRVTVINEGSSFPRQRIDVPTPFWTTDIVSPQDLGVLDFFEKGETVTLSITPNHINNPAAGNVTGATVFPQAAATGYPFLAGQYDTHEGIATPSAMDTNVDEDIDVITEDVISRIPNGIATIGFIGFRIVQSPGVAL